MLMSGGVTCAPGTGEWITEPLRCVQRLYEESAALPGWEPKVTNYFQEKIQENQSCWVPSLNDVPLHYLKPNSLVRFRCMVQDMFDPEYYMGVYETVDRSNNARALHLGKYRDVADCKPQQEVDINSSKTVTAERQTFYCVPVPGESTWVKEIYSSSSQAKVAPSTSYVPNRQKRSYDEGDEHSATPREQHTDVSEANIPKRHEMESQKKPKESASAISAPMDLNFPLPDEKGPACLVKVYENWDNFKVNDVLEVFGVLLVEPCLSVINEDRDPLSACFDPADSMDTLEEQRVHSPPTSLVPRIHAIIVQKLHHNNPLIPSSVCETDESKQCLASFMAELCSVRSELLGFLTHALLGDGLAAEYLIFHLISNVYARRDVLPLGKFTLNLSGCPRNGMFTQHLHRVVQQLVPTSYYLRMTIENMNSLRFIPQKDYNANRLLSGILQLSSHTSLLVDETLLEQGQLDTTGVRNVTALGNVITWQKVDYDFSYHRMEFPCNINVLVASEGRSLLPSDCQIHLKPQLVPPNMEQYMVALLSAVQPSLLNKFRIYISLLQMMDYSISEDVTKFVEDDFVDMRKDDPQSMSAEDLHRLLLVARLLSLSSGHGSLSRERWQKAKQLESQRKSRLQDQKHFGGNEL
ncbi:mini-chromosome maintenance complex-binding protein isoform X1 [Rana temporaria]|uniref:mini-chromosome maintenance complex-binding protein isoform X1 n=1 Tax=Rana temporaria TaxID=8407 RepID=UPI001AAD6FEE|nr:mini-chromosome maintenance complex-binding protein isoform X1 [Rana temporaria]